MMVKRNDVILCESIINSAYELAREEITLVTGYS